MVLKDNDMSLKVKLCQEWITTQEHLPQKFGKIRRSIFANFKPVFFLLKLVVFVSSVFGISEFCVT